MILKYLNIFISVIWYSVKNHLNIHQDLTLKCLRYNLTNLAMLKSAICVYSREFMIFTSWFA